MYEDDLYKITPALGISGFDLWKLILGSGWEGRPLQDSLIYLISFFGIRLGGLHLVYVLGYLIVTANAFLFFTFLKRLSNENIFALTGALAFCLFPADTTHAFLTHSLGLQPSLAFLLGAFLCYLSGEKMASYGVILGSLFCYETMIPVFLVAPLLTKNWDPKKVRELGRHAFILGSMLVCAFVIRRFFAGEGRCVQLSFLEGLLLSTEHMLKGPVVCLLMFLYRSTEIIFTFHANMIMPVSLCFAGFAWLLFQQNREPAGAGNKKGAISSPERCLSLGRLAWIGVAMLVLAYPITFTTNVTDIASGRESRVHAAAVVGASILCACFCSRFFLIANAYRRKGIAALSLAVFFASLVGFGLTVQKDYATSWQYQRAFWTDVIALCPDMTEGTIILVESHPLKNPQQIRAHFVCVYPSLLESIYQFPNNWENVPRVYALKLRWQEKVVSGEDSFLLSKMVLFWQPFPGQRSDGMIHSTSAILLGSRNGRLTRRTEPLIINGHEFRLKEKPVMTSPPFPKGPLYRYLIKDLGEKPVDYLVE
ncbi:MAG: hypothetical protein V1882_07335 [Candidatus Omnitrophota bacterium]